ncbi:MAG: leucine-rich repeat domain-containing protein, partial [Lachnospiraceae bacterium]
EVKGLLYQVTGNASVTFAGVKDTTLKTIKIPTTVMIDDRMYKVTKVAGKALYKNKKVTSVTVGNNVTEIGDQAFAQCSKLKNITLGTKVEKLGKKTFYQDKKLAKLVIKSKKLKSIGKGSFKGVPKKVKISAPKAQQKKYTKLINNA